MSLNYIIRFIIYLNNIIYYIYMLQLQAPSNASDRAALKALERENALLAQTIAELRAGSGVEEGSGMLEYSTC